MRDNCFAKQLEDEYGVTDDLRNLHRLQMVFADEALQTLPAEHQRKLSSVPVVLLPIADINALCGVTDQGESFVVLNLSLSAFLEVFSCLFLAGMATGKSRREVVTIENAQLLVDTVAALISGEPSHIQDRLKDILSEQKPSSNQLLVRTAFLNALVSWIVGHEYGHIVLGHLGTIRSFVLRGSSRQLSFRERQQREELHADQFGLDFATRGIDASRPDLELSSIFRLAAADVCCSLFRVVEYCQEIADYWLEKSLWENVDPRLGSHVHAYVGQSRVSHPRARIRHERIRALGPCKHNHSVLTLAGNAQIIVEQVMLWMHENRLSLDKISRLVEKRFEELPQSIWIKFAEELQWRPGRIKL